MVEKNDVSLETQDSVDVKRNVPILRFPKFKEKWKTLILDDVIKEFVNGQTPSRNHDEYWKGNIPWLSSGELNYGFINDSIEKITEKGQKSANLRILPRNTFLIAIFGLEATGTRGSCGILNIPSTISQACMALIPYEEKLKMNFLYYWYNKVGDLYGVKYTQGTKQQNFNIELLKKLSITLPSNLEEQEKIANFLSLIDKKIEFLEKTLVLYQKYGKSIKNNYFDNLETDTCTKFKEIIKKGKAGGTPKSTNKEFYGGKIPFLSINDMTKQGKYIKNTEKSITEKGLDNSSAWIVPKGSLLYSIYASIGFVSINTIDLSTSQAIYGIILKENINQDFIYHYLQDFKRHIHKYIETGTQGNLNSKIVQNLEIKLPSLKEQNYYSIFFNNLDYKTEVIQKSIDELREYKKGLLQKMFI